MNFIFRDFGIIRVKTLTMFGGSKSVPMHTNAIKEIVQRDSSDEENEEDQELDEIQRQMEEMGDDQELYQVENHYALFAFYDDYKCLSRGEIFVELKIDGEFKYLMEKVSGVAELLRVESDQMKDKITAEKERLCKQIFDNLVVVKTVSQDPSDEHKHIVKYRLLVDAKQAPMSEVIDQLKQQKYKV